MLVTTTPGFEGARIAEYKGLVTGEAIVGANIVRDIFASVRDIVGGRSAAYEKELEKARNLAMEEMVAKAESMGANAIMGILVPLKSGEGVYGQKWAYRNYLDLFDSNS